MYWIWGKWLWMSDFMAPVLHRQYIDPTSSRLLWSFFKSIEVKSELCVNVCYTPRFLIKLQVQLRFLLTSSCDWTSYRQWLIVSIGREGDWKTKEETVWSERAFWYRSAQKGLQIGHTHLLSSVQWLTMASFLKTFTPLLALLLPLMDIDLFLGAYSGFLSVAPVVSCEPPLPLSSFTSFEARLSFQMTAVCVQLQVRVCPSVCLSVCMCHSAVQLSQSDSDVRHIMIFYWLLALEA